MKKLISIVLSLVMLMSAALTASATNIDSFETCIGKDFDNNYFFVETFDYDNYSQNVTGEYFGATAKLKISTTSNDSLKLKVAIYDATSEVATLVESNEITISSSVAYEKVFESDYSDIFGHSDAVIGFALVNDNELTSDATVTVELSGQPYNLNGFGNEFTYGKKDF